MRLSNIVAGAMLGLVVSAVAPAMAAPASAPPDAAGELDAVRQECIAAARETQQREEAVGTLEHDIDLIGRDAAGRQRGLDESRVEQAEFLGTIERVARHPPDRFAAVLEAPIDRIRSELLLQAALPALRAEARALSGEIARIAVLRAEIAAKEDELAGARDALGKDRERLAQLTARRLELNRRVLPEDAGGAARLAKLGQEASGIADLIKRADAATDRRDKALLAHARAAQPRTKASALTAETADLTQPHELHAFEPPQSALLMPVSGTISRHFGTADAAGKTSQGLSLAARAGAAVVAPFDGRVVYAGPFGTLGLVLIIRHGALYHSLLAGLGRVDIKLDQWVLAGEPVGAMPDAPPPYPPPPAGEGREGGFLGGLYFELRRDGRPVDPQRWLATRGGQDGDQRVRE